MIMSGAMGTVLANFGRQRQLQKLIDRLGLLNSASVRWELVDLALTHPTASALANYEQLEFVGDAVVRLFVAELLWEYDHPGTVGEWSAVRSVLVSDRILADLAYVYGLEQFLSVGPSAAGDHRGETSRLADAFEALLGALYLSTRDLSLIQPWLLPQLQQQAAIVRADPTYQNYKAALQQWTQAHYHLLPEYRVQALQPQTLTPAPNSEEARFSAEVWLQGECLAVGIGRSIKAAEKAAAQAAFTKITQS
jgi:ribonuclease-3